MAKAYSVTEINNYIKNMFDSDYLLSEVTVIGEVSNCKYHSSGHIYFTLKDKEAQLMAIMFKGNVFSGLNFKLNDGQKITVKGAIKIFERDGRYQIYARKIEKAGEGDLYKKYLELKNELADMGMFDSVYKKPVKRYNKKIGVVTAKTGAAIQDIINISKRRNPYVEIVLYPAIVQGPMAKYSICDGIKELDKLNLDVIIVGRGGGSIEDLWAFNEEIVAREIFNCNTPVISAVGHETDFTIVDFVADLRASTPSAAAELAVCEIEAVENEIAGYRNVLDKLITKIITEKRNEIQLKNIILSKYYPVKRLEDYRTLLINMEKSLEKAISMKIFEKKSKLLLTANHLEALSPLKRLASGYSVITLNDEILKSTKNVKPGDEIKASFIDGLVVANVLKVIGEDTVLEE